MPSHVADFNTRNQILTAKLLKQGYRYHKLRKTFLKLYRRHSDLVSKYNTVLKSLLKQGLSEPEFYGDLVYKFKKIVGRNDFSDQFKKITIRYKRIGYNMNVMRQTACLVVNPITANSFAYLFICTPLGIRLNNGSGIKLSVKLAGAWWSVFGRAHRGSTVGLLLLQRFRVGLPLSTRLVSSQWWILIYMFAVLIHWWVEVLPTYRTTSMCIWTTAEPRVKLLLR